LLSALLGALADLVILRVAEMGVVSERGERGQFNTRHPAGVQGVNRINDELRRVGSRAVQPEMPVLVPTWWPVCSTLLEPWTAQESAIPCIPSFSLGPGFRCTCPLDTHSETHPRDSRWRAPNYVNTSIPPRPPDSDLDPQPLVIPHGYRTTPLPHGTQATRIRSSSPFLLFPLAAVERLLGYANAASTECRSRKKLVYSCVTRAQRERSASDR
jgi:hypothetical protein